MAQGGGAAPPTEAVRKGMSKTLLAVVVVVVAILAFVGGIGMGNLLYAPKPTTSPFLVVGTNIPFPPFEDYNYTTGQYIGFDINFSEMIAVAAHRQLVINNYANFNTLLTTVGKGGVDMAASAITESGATGQNRSHFMSFSDPYYDANQGVLIQPSNPAQISCPSSNCSNPSILDKTGFTLGVQSGTTSQSWTTAYVKNATVKVFDDVTLEIAALEAGSLTAVIIDNGPAGALASGSGGQMTVAGVIFTGEQYGFAVALGDPQGLLPIINSVISEAKANGTYNQMLTYWFR
jgi:polar amino acid transport system substrate-binding protein